MNDLDEIYKRLAHDWPQEELAARYASAWDRGPRAIKNPRPTVARALSMVVSALPPAATLAFAVYVLHMLGATTQDELAIGSSTTRSRAQRPRFTPATAHSNSTAPPTATPLRSGS